MKKVLMEKIRNHPRLRKMLVETEDSLIIEDCTKRKGGSGKFLKGQFKDRTGNA